jgi:hypothetical protein
VRCGVDFDAATRDDPCRADEIERPLKEMTMATVMLMHWPEVSKTQYEETRKEVKWETNVPTGAKFHVAWFAGDGLHVLDIWDSRKDFEKFVDQRLMPAVKKIGIKGEPKVTFEEAHAIFAPNV